LRLSPTKLRRYNLCLSSKFFPEEIYYYLYYVYYYYYYYYYNNLYLKVQAAKIPKLITIRSHDSLLMRPPL